ncbi:MAG: nucleotidyltransferase family protein [Pseudomonadota bacterium]
MKQTEVGALLLGGGVSRRFGSDKRQHALGDSFVADQTLRIYVATFPRVCVVLREADPELARRLHDLHPQVQIVHAAQSSLGMGHSLAAGAQTVTWHWTFVGLLDMPFVQSQTLNLLQAATAQVELEAGAAKTIVRPSSVVEGGTRTGHPIGFHHSLLPALQALTGDEGARSVVRAHAAQVLDVPVIDQGIFRDIDTPKDVPPRD